MNFYAHEKLNELREEQLKNQLLYVETKTAPRAFIGGPVGGAGRVLRRVGEGLESWANQPSQQKTA